MDDLKERIEQWARTMGYQGKFPKKFDTVCNPVSAPVWEQVIVKVKPRKEVERIRNKIILHELQLDEKGKLDEHLNILGADPAKEIRAWRERRDAEERLKGVATLVESKRKEAENAAMNNRTVYVKIESIKNHIKELESKSYLYEKKSEKTTKEIKLAEEQLENLAQMTAANKQNCNVDKIKDDIEKCIVVLKRQMAAMKEDSLNQTNVPAIIHPQNTSNALSVTDGQSNTNFLNLQKPVDLYRTNQFNANMLSVPKPLTNVTPLCQNSSYRMKPRNLNMSAMALCQNRQFKGSSGSLNQSVLNTTNLSSGHRRRKPLMTPWTFNPRSQSTFVESTRTFNESENKIELFIRKKPKVVEEAVERFLRLYDPDVLWGVFNEALCNLTTELTDEVTCQKNEETEVVDIRTGECKIKAIYIKNTIAAKACRKRCKELETYITMQEYKIKEFLEANFPSEQHAELTENLKQNKEGVKKSAILASLTQSLDELKMLASDEGLLEEVELELQKLNKDVMDSKIKLAQKQELLKDILKHLQLTIKRGRELTVELGAVIQEFSADSFHDNCNAEEVKAFADYCLELNKRYTYTKPDEDIYLRDNVTHTLPYADSYDNSKCKAIGTIIQSPSSFPEAILVTMLGELKRDEALRSLKEPEIQFPINHYTLDQLEKGEASLKREVEALRRFERKLLHNNMEKDLTRIYSLLDLWREVPLIMQKYLKV